MCTMSCLQAIPETAGDHNSLPPEPREPAAGAIAAEMVKPSCPRFGFWATIAWAVVLLIGNEFLMAIGILLEFRFKRSRRLLAVRRIRPGHLVLILALALPTVVLCFLTAV